MQEALKFLFWFAGFWCFLALLAYIFFVDVLVVGHDGMAPTLMMGDRMVVWRGAHAETGDVVVCRRPGSSERVVGRVFGAAGEHIGSDRGAVTRGNHRLDTEGMGEVDFYSSEVQRSLHAEVLEEDLAGTTHKMLAYPNHPISIPDHNPLRGFFLLNDNRTMLRHDSREFGVVTECSGQVIMRLNGTAPRVPGFTRFPIMPIW